MHSFERKLFPLSNGVSGKVVQRIGRELFDLKARGDIFLNHPVQEYRQCVVIAEAVVVTIFRNTHQLESKVNSAPTPRQVMTRNSHHLTHAPLGYFYNTHHCTVHNGTAAGSSATRILSHGSLHFYPMQDTLECVSLSHDIHFVIIYDDFKVKRKRHSSTRSSLGGQ